MRQSDLIYIKTEEGNVKNQSNLEIHRNYITRHRADIEFSSDFEALEDTYISLGKNDSDTGTVYKMNKKEQQVLESFMIGRNQMNLMSKCNVDKNGKARNYDPATNRPIVIGDGVIPQLERFADKYAYSKMSTDIFDTMLSSMRQKSKKSMGNKYVFVANEMLWDDIQKALRDYLKNWKTNGTTFFSKAGGKDIEIGGFFETYNMGGNQLTFMVDKSLSLEYDQKPYGFCLDLTADLASGKPAMASYALAGKEYKQHILRGVGSSSVEVSSVVAASRIINIGYSSVCVFSPHKSYIIEGNKPNKY